MENQDQNQLKKYYLDFREIAETIMKRENIHEGIWSIFVEFNYAATNLNSPSGTFPSFITAVKSVGIFPAQEENNIAFDASKLNPAPKPKKKTKAK